MLEVFRTPLMPPFFSTRMLSLISAILRYVCVLFVLADLFSWPGATCFSTILFVVLIDKFCKLFFFVDWIYLYLTVCVHDFA